MASTTCGQNHDLIPIYSAGPEMEETVIRWCRECGVVVIDIDSDGRTSPGAIMKMRWPMTERRKYHQS